MDRIYAIGDIHGQKAALDHALGLILVDGGPEAHIVFLGDYTDRGPESRAVLETLINGQADGRNWTCIMGNHDRMFARYIRHGTEHDSRIRSGLSWLNPRLGGSATLASYGLSAELQLERRAEDGLEWLSTAISEGLAINPEAFHANAQAAVPEAHLTFLENLPIWHETQDLIFVHAGLRPHISLPHQDPDDLIWIREGFLESTHNFGKLIVHGHTALDKPQHFGNRVDLDGGAGYGNPLIPAVFEGRQSWLLTDQGRVPLRPAPLI